jgi:hypothetical protein
MNRHPFRWDAIAFGLFFLAVLGQWAVWEQDLLTPDDLAYGGAAVLIVLGVLGIIGTAISARPDRRTAPFTPTEREGDERRRRSHPPSEGGVGGSQNELHTPARTETDDEPRSEEDPV